jgi:BirA family biotin operon repressor/biotin-[acetyl-CoA-carboxylase] ligase
LLADTGAFEGDWLVAQSQSAGRGRQGRQWQSPAGNFHGSTLVMLSSGDPPAPSLSLASGLALIDAAEVAAPDALLSLKWPNDLLSGSAKLGGILLERMGDRVVAGFGINLAEAPALDGRATAALPSQITPQAFAPLIAAAFARTLQAWRSKASLVEQWLGRAHPLGAPLTVHASPGEQVTGTFDGLEPNGALRLRLADGCLRVMHAGDVSLGQG